MPIMILSETVRARAKQTEIWNYIEFNKTSIRWQMRVVILPGNGAGDVEHANWYGWLRDKITGLKRDDVTSHLKNMPDPVGAREKIWLPFMKEKLLCGEDTIIVGHSSGAAAAMRFCETYKVFGIILVGAYTSDLGDECERDSGYFSRPWQWQKIRENAGFIVQFGSRDDPFLPWSEQCEVGKQLNADFRQFNDKGHFMSSTFPLLRDEIVKHL